jgi:hypothetical protein
MKTIYKKIRAYIRLQKINDKKSEKMHFENQLFDSWKNKYKLSYDDRIEVIKNVVERIKQDSEKRYIDFSNESVKICHQNDKVKNISFFTL